LGISENGKGNRHRGIRHKVKRCQMIASLL
jgi:hypothetical protein